MEVHGFSHVTHQIIPEPVFVFLEKIKAILSRALKALHSLLPWFHPHNIAPPQLAPQDPGIQDPGIRDIQIIQRNQQLTFPDDALQTREQVMDAWLEYLHAEFGLDGDPDDQQLIGRGVSSLPPKNLALALVRHKVNLYSDLLMRLACKYEEIAYACCTDHDTVLWFNRLADRAHIVDVGNRWPWFAHVWLRIAEEMIPELAWELLMSACEYILGPTYLPLDHSGLLKDYNWHLNRFVGHYTLPLTEQQMQQLLNYSARWGTDNNPFETIIVRFLSRGILNNGVCYTPTIESLTTRPDNWADQISQLFEGSIIDLHDNITTMLTSEESFQPILEYLQGIKPNHKGYTKAQSYLGHLYHENKLYQDAGFALLNGGQAFENRMLERSDEAIADLHLAVTLLLFKQGDRYVLRNDAEVPPKNSSRLQHEDIVSLTTPDPRSRQLPLIRILQELLEDQRAGARI